VLGWLFRAAKAIPIASSKDDPAALERAYADIGKALADGELVCVFPEGRLTRDGALGELRGGVLKVATDNSVPVVPMAVRGMEGSIFSRCLHLRRGWQRLVFRRIQVRATGAIAPQALSLDDLRAAIVALYGPGGH